MFMQWSRRVAFCFCLCFLLAGFQLAWAQNFFGSIVGTVTDSSSGAIAGANVTLTNLGTSDRKSAATDSSGTYRFLNLPPGRYKVEFESPGFKHLTKDQILVEVQNEFVSMRP